jgi:ATP phosphoribosyltransferase
MERGVTELLSEAGIVLSRSERAYRPTISLEGFEVKILKPQNIIEMISQGTRDLGFAGADWVGELKAQGRLKTELVPLLDTGLDPVRLVVAFPRNSPLEKDSTKPVRIASEYTELAELWLKNQKLSGTVVRSFGATEVFAPEDADGIIDITQSGATLRENDLVVADEILTSSTRLYANGEALDNPILREPIERFVLLVRSVLEARTRVMVELNVSASALESVIAALPCLRQPTISTLHREEGYAVKAAVPRKELPTLIPEIKQRGGTDIVVTRIAQLVG